MAETRNGTNWIVVPAHTRMVKGKPVQVRAHDRSTPNTSKGAAKGK